MDQKLSIYGKNHSIYLIKYLRNLLKTHFDEINKRNFEEHKLLEGRVIISPDISKNDKYLVNKL